MLYYIEQAIISILETASIPGVNAIISGFQKIIANNSYPVIGVDIQDMTPTFNGNKIDLEITGAVVILSINPSPAESFQEISDIAWDLDDNTGVIPSLIFPRSLISVGDDKFRITIGKSIKREGSDSNGRAVYGMEIPITLVTKKTI